MDDKEAVNDPCSYRPEDIPDLEELMQWESEGYCYTPDGCLVEPDGRCPHGCKSWLLILGYI